MKSKPIFMIRDDPHREPGYIAEVNVNGKTYQRQERTKADAVIASQACRQALRLPGPPSKLLTRTVRMQRARGADRKIKVRTAGRPMLIPAN